MLYKHCFIWPSKDAHEPHDADSLQQPQREEKAIETAGPRVHGCWEHKRCSHCGNQYDLHTELPCDPASAFRGMYPKDVKAETRTDTYTFIAALFSQWPKDRGKPGVH